MDPCSHGVGGLYSRVFAARHTSQVKGLLLVDTVPESLIPKIFTPGEHLYYSFAE